MAYPYTLTNAVDGVTEIEAAHLNNLEAYVGIVGSSDTNSLTYKLTNANQIDPGHKHTHAALSGTMGVDGDILHKASGAWSPKTPDAAGIVDKSTSQTIGGAKTFSVIPILPGTDPTQANEAARKGYVDGAISSHASLPNAHHSQAHGITSSDHTASGLTVGQVLRATGSTTFAFQALQESDLPSHKHSKLWESDGGAEAIDVDANGIIKVPSKVAPSSSQADAALLWAEDVNGEAGKAGLHLMNEVLSGVKLVAAGIYIKTNTGDPSSYYEGLIVLNTVDNTLKIYADQGWRTLATWS